MRNRAAGFTLVEMLVAMGLSAIVLMAVYMVFIGNSTQYYVQEQLVQGQETSRFAMEFLKAELRSAGQLSIANGDTAGGFQDSGLIGVNDIPNGLELFDDEVGAGVPLVIGRPPNQLAPDRLRLLSDASGITPLMAGSIVGGTVTLDPAASQPAAAARQLLGNRAAFEAMYRANTYLRVERTDRGAVNWKDLVRIDAVDFGTLTIRLARQPNVYNAQVDCSGVCMVNPVELVEYRLADDPDQAGKTDLVRFVLDARTPDTLGNALDRLVVAEYVVNFQVWGTYDVRGNGAGTFPNVPADADPTDDVGNWVGMPLQISTAAGPTDEAVVMNARPDRVRALNVLIAVRTPREDEAFNLTAGMIDFGAAAGDRIAADRTWFDVVATPGSGLARVATLTSTVETPTMRRF